MENNIIVYNRYLEVFGLKKFLKSRKVRLVAYFLASLSFLLLCLAVIDRGNICDIWILFIFFLIDGWLFLSVLFEMVSEKVWKPKSKKCGDVGSLKRFFSSRKVRILFELIASYGYLKWSIKSFIIGKYLLGVCLLLVALLFLYYFTCTLRGEKKDN